jgi:hypothetical protein
MHNYNRNHQLYLAERSEWLERHVNKTSKRELMKVTSLKNMIAEGRPVNQISMVMDLVQKSLLKTMPNKTILMKEGYFLTNIDN